jgi:hypothetical protein
MAPVQRPWGGQFVSWCIVMDDDRGKVYQGNVLCLLIKLDITEEVKS